VLGVTSKRELRITGILGSSRNGLHGSTSRTRAHRYRYDSPSMSGQGGFSLDACTRIYHRRHWVWPAHATAHAMSVGGLGMVILDISIMRG
jgi:hypothetical protein